MDLTFRVVRDLFSPEVDEFVVDDRAAYDKCVGYVQALVPALEQRVRLYTERAPIFDAFGIEKDDRDGAAPRGCRSRAAARSCSTRARR